jgi:hypothetical protein
MLRQENSYRLYSDVENIPYWNMAEIVAQLPFLYSKGRNKVNGKPAYKSRAFPGYLKQRGQGIWQEAFTKQDAARQKWREIEMAGQMPHLYLETTFGRVRLNNDLAEFFLETSEIANLYVSGWRFTAE